MGAYNMQNPKTHYKINIFNSWWNAKEILKLSQLYNIYTYI